MATPAGLFLAAIMVSSVSARLTLSLDGTWHFTMLPSSASPQQLGSKTSGDIVVPGAWQAQGYGESTATMRHQYIGAAAYERSVEVPASYLRPGQSVWLVVERAERSVNVIVGGKLLKEHTGYLSPCEVEITQQIFSNRTAAITLIVNATRTLRYDGLEGEQDLVTDGTNLGGWGGIGGHVRLESRAEQWLVAPHIQTFVAQSFNEANVTASCRIVTQGDSYIAATYLHTIYKDSQGTVVGSSYANCTKDLCGGLDNTVALTNVSLWSPQSPVQYSAELQLFDASNTLLDQMTVQFGVRHLEVVGYHWKLNGRWLFLHGYGDDSIYPDTIAPPLNTSEYLSRLKFAKSLGMNFVRHHSHILPDEYFEAACATGIMVSAEFPIAYGLPADCSKGECNSVYESDWNATVLRLRNFPCVFDYTMDNEDVNLLPSLATALHSAAKELDPGRLVNTADGIFGSATARLPNPVDFRSYQGGDWMQVPTGNPNQFNIPGVPPTPIINHEMGNFVSWPRLDLQISEFTDNIRPYWLQPARDHLEQISLLQENDLWWGCSNKLYTFCWKNSLEAVRKTEKISGNEWWLLQDFWMGSNGIVDTYFKPKHPPEEIAELANLNSPVMLLVAEPGDNLPLNETEPRLQRAYSSRDKLRTSLHVSNYGAEDISGASLRWQLVGSDGAAICQDAVAIKPVPQGPGTTMGAAVECDLPDLGSFTAKPKPPVTLHLNAQLVVGGVTLSHNHWQSRLYARPQDGPSPPANTVYTQQQYCNAIPVSNMKCSIPVAGTKLPVSAVFVVDYLDSTLLGFAAEGAVLIVINNGTSSSGIDFPTEPANFKTAWWLGSETDNNMGTVVYNSSSPITSGMAPEGWADEGWFNLIQGGRNLLLDKLPSQVEVLVRSIDLIGASQSVSSLQDNPYKVLSRPKALMWQAGIDGGNSPDGAIIMTGLNILVNHFAPGSIGATRPEAAWMLHKLLQYAYSNPRPTKTLKVRITQCPGCLPSQNVNLCPA